MSVHVYGRGSAPRRVVLSCDVAGCSVQVEPPAAERWRSDADAQSWARTHAVGWTYDSARGTDYCPDHAEFSTAPAAGALPPRPTAAVRDAARNPLDRDDYATQLKARLTTDSQPAGDQVALTAGQAHVAARLLDELAGVYRGEDLGTLAHELAMQLDNQLGERG